jgi:restriction endonuclease
MVPKSADAVSKAQQEFIEKLQKEIQLRRSGEPPSAAALGEKEQLAIRLRQRLERTIAARESTVKRFEAEIQRRENLIRQLESEIEAEKSAPASEAAKAAPKKPGPGPSVKQKQKK